MIMCMDILAMLIIFFLGFGIRAIVRDWRVQERSVKRYGCE